MELIEAREAYYPSFPIGAEPMPIPCELRVVEANGRKYLKTPFAMLDAHGGDLDRHIDGRGFYATQAECEAYLKAEYPWADVARPIMAALAVADGLVGRGRLCDRLGISPVNNDLYMIARGHKRFTRKQIREYATKLAN